MRTAEVKRRFLDFYESRGHTAVPSASLLLDDPTLLFVNAGMVPFKPYFLGDQTPPWARATSVQKCLRTQDIEEVGRTSRHGTFFQMNGNFSFGDYFKEQAIAYAWELVTTPRDGGGYGLDPERLWVTVYLDDDEAIEIWKRVAGLPDERIVRRGMADNFWSMTVPGPCGPCSELYYDRGPQYGPDGGPAVDEDRFTEFWNLVFMQSERGAGPAKEGYPILGPLPRKNIDTGMGLERMASLLQGVDNLYEIDEVRPVLDRAADLAGRPYGADADDDVRLRVVADHVRSALMVVSDGVVPANEGRGYVLRRLIRRAIRSMRLLGVEGRVLGDLLRTARDAMAPSYPELLTDWERISAVALAEEDAFDATLRAGSAVFDEAVTTLRAAGGSRLSGSAAFTLHDTYGFPIDLTLEMAADAGLSVDREGFTGLMAEQRTRAREDARSKKTGHVDVSVHAAVAAGLGEPVVFTGYDTVAGSGVVRALLVGGLPVDHAEAGSAVEVVLDRTPFYAQAGGQVADRGTLTTASGAVDVDDVQRPVPGLTVHRGLVTGGTVVVGETAAAAVDVDRRRAVSRAHTATHLVHQALRDTLGPTATQRGSEDAPGRLRFDFSWSAALPAEVLGGVEAAVNDRVADDLAVTATELPLAEAKAAGAMALFGERYPDVVRMVSISDWSRELCGGTHTASSGQLGLVTVLGESSVGSGVRRVEALVGADAFGFLTREHAVVDELSRTLRTQPEALADRVGGLVTRLADAERELRRLRTDAVLAGAADLAAGARDVGGVRLVAHAAPDGTRADDLRSLVLDVRARLGEQAPAVAAAAAVLDGRPAVVIALNAAAQAAGLAAGTLVRTAAQAMGGSGGGKADLAQGGGTEAAALPQALAAVERAVENRVGAAA